MFEYDLVRRMYYREGISLREICRRTGYHRRTIGKMLQYSAPPGYCLKNPRIKVKLEPFIPIIDKILEDDRIAPKKQRHTAQRIYARLRDEHSFTGSYTIVKDYVRDKKYRLREVYFPLEHRPGTYQVDFGQAEVRIGGLEENVHFFCMALPYSDALFLSGYPTEAFEAVADGHTISFEFLEGVPPDGLYDNMSPIVKSVLGGHEREVTDNFLALRSHYLFNSSFCNVRRANEKGVVERLIGYVRKNFLVPVLSFRDYPEMNAYFAEQCRKRLSQKATGKDKTIGELLAEERATFLPLSATTFEACRLEERRATSLSLVRFAGNSYSVPVEYAYREVVVKAYPFRVEICHKDLVIARHQRTYRRDDFIFDPLHYLPLLEKKPGALDGALPFTSWELPKNFDLLRRYLEGRNNTAGKREYIRILQLLRDFGLSEVNRAIERAFAYSCVNFESIKMLILSAGEPEAVITRLSPERLSLLPRAHVKITPPTAYAALLEGGVR